MINKVLILIDSVFLCLNISNVSLFKGVLAFFKDKKVVDYFDQSPF